MCLRIYVEKSSVACKVIQSLRESLPKKFIVVFVEAYLFKVSPAQIKSQTSAFISKLIKRLRLARRHS